MYSRGGNQQKYDYCLLKVVGSAGFWVPGSGGTLGSGFRLGGDLGFLVPGGRATESRQGTSAAAARSAQRARRQRLAVRLHNVAPPPLHSSQPWERRPSPPSPPSGNSVRLEQCELRAQLDAFSLVTARIHCPRPRSRHWPCCCCMGARRRAGGARGAVRLSAGKGGRAAPGGHGGRGPACWAGRATPGGIGRKAPGGGRMAPGRAGRGAPWGLPWNSRPGFTQCL